MIEQTIKDIFNRFQEGILNNFEPDKLRDIKDKNIPYYLAEDIIQIFFSDECYTHYNNNYINDYYFNSNRLSGIYVNVYPDFIFSINNNQIIVEKLMFKLHLIGHKLEYFIYLTVCEEFILVKISDYEVGFDGTRESIIIDFKNINKAVEVSTTLLEGLLFD